MLNTVKKAFSILAVAFCLLSSVNVFAASNEKVTEYYVLPPSEPKPYAYWDFRTKDEEKKIWYDDAKISSDENGLSIKSDEAKIWQTVFGVNSNNLYFKDKMDYTIMLRYKANKEIPAFQMVVNCDDDGKEKGLYYYRYDTQNFNCLGSMSYYYKDNKFYEWIGDFQYIDGEEYDTVSFHFYVPEGSKNTYFKFQLCEFEEKFGVNITIDSFAVFSGYADLTDEKAVNSKNPKMYQKPEYDTKKAVLPSSPIFSKRWTFDNAKEIKDFWYDNVEVSHTGSAYKAYLKDGVNFATLIASNPSTYAFEMGNDYTIMIRYKNCKTIPAYQFVVNSTKDMKEYGLYVMRWDANNFTQLLCSSYDYKRNVLKDGIADFQYISDGDYTVVSFHIYVPYGYETPYFKLQTTDAQVSKVIDFECDTLAIYKGYADLTSADDINSDTPQMPDIEIETKNASFLEDVTFVRGDKNSSSEDETNKTEIAYIIPAVVGVIVGPIILAAGIAVFIILLLKRKKESKGEV